MLNFDYTMFKRVRISFNVYKIKFQIGNSYLHLNLLAFQFHHTGCNGLS